MSRRESDPATALTFAMIYTLAVILFIVLLVAL